MMWAKRLLGVFLVVGVGGAVSARADTSGETVRLIPNDMTLCGANAKGPAALVRIHGFKDRMGNIRIQTYTDNQDELLEKGKYLNRIVTAVVPTGVMTVCVPFSAPGRYVIFVIHDRNANNGLGFSDGAAFSNNPPIKFALPKPPKPSARDAALDVTTGVLKTDITMNYLSGFAIKPIDSPTQ